ncbi:MAG: hypothetical protein Rubg2KO_25420 [Rubricoccaceae bacterium]
MNTSSRLPLVLSLSAVVLVGVAAVLWLTRSVTEDVPLPPDRSAAGPGAEFVNAEASEAYYREWLRREPDAVEPRVRLAHVLLQLAGTTGDEYQLVPEAQALLDDALARDAEHYYARTLKAQLLNKLHEFEAARDLSRDLLADYPEHAFVYGTLIDALVELGDYEEAVAASDQMLALRPGLPAYSRASYLRELHGDADGAIAAMRLAANAEPTGRPARSWALLKLGELYLGSAKPDTAAYIFQGLLEEDPNFAPALAALGHVALVQGDADGAVRQLEQARALRSGGATDELLVEAYLAAGDEAKAEEASARVYQSLMDAREMGERVDMEEADLLADQGRQLDNALELARAEVERRPGHLHANETYAWTLHHMGRSNEAIPYIERAMRLNSGDAMVHYRAAAIYQGAGQTAQAAEHFRAALDGHVGVESPSTAAEAQRALAALSSESPPTLATRAEG